MARNDLNYKIAFVGNVNCMTFRYALELKQLGHDVIFFVDYPKSEKLHRPEYRFSEISYPYPIWIKEISQPKRNVSFLFPTAELASFIKTLKNNGFDALILNGIWHKISVHISNVNNLKIMSFFSGADLDVLASYKAVWSIRHANSLIIHYAKLTLRLLEVWIHRRGIRKASFINYYAEGVSPKGDRMIDEIMKGRTFHRLQIRGMRIEDVKYHPPSKRLGADVIIFNATRFLWKAPLPVGFTNEENKRNDIMLSGIATFYKRTGIGIKVILVEKGVHVLDTKLLIDKLGIAHLVTWHKEMSQQDIFRFYQDADIVFDQLGEHWVGGGMDAMLIGRPVIANGRPDVFNKILGAPIPLCQATNENEVADWLVKLVMDAELRKQIGLRSREFVIKHFNATETAMQIIKHIESDVNQ